MSIFDLSLGYHSWKAQRTFLVFGPAGAAFEGEYGFRLVRG